VLGIYLVHDNLVSGCREYSIRSYLQSVTTPNYHKTVRAHTSERFRSSSNASNILAARKSLAALQIAEEVQNISREASRRARSNEAVDSGASIRALIELPAHTVNRDRSDRRSRAGDRTSSTESTEPDHDFVGGGTTCGSGGEDVVCHVCNDTGARVSGIV
jgi:hypothetical protein